MFRIYCFQCGAFGEGSTPEEAWKNVPHEGHSHKAEEMSYEEAKLFMEE